LLTQKFDHKNLTLLNGQFVVFNFVQLQLGCRSAAQGGICDSRVAQAQAAVELHTHSFNHFHFMIP